MALDGIYNCKALLFFLIVPDSGSESIAEKLFSWLSMTALSNRVYTLLRFKMQVARIVMRKQIGCDIIYENMDFWMKSTTFHFI